MDNSQMVFCKIEDIQIMNRQLEDLIESVEIEDSEDCEDCEYCEYCLGYGFVQTDNEEYDCEYCDICDFSLDDTDSDYEPNWSSANDTEEDSDSSDSDDSDSDIEICYLGDFNYVDSINK